MVTGNGVVDSARLKELKDLFCGHKAGLVFVTAFDNRETAARFINQVSWETEVWVACEPEHVIHLNGERLCGPYPDTMRAGRR